MVDTEVHSVFSVACVGVVSEWTGQERQRQRVASTEAAETGEAGECSSVSARVLMVVVESRKTRMSIVSRVGCGCRGAGCGVWSVGYRRGGITSSFPGIPKGLGNPFVCVALWRELQCVLGRDSAKALSMASIRAPRSPETSPHCKKVAVPL